MSRISKKEFENYAELVKQFFVATALNEKEQKYKKLATDIAGTYLNGLRQQNPLVFMLAIENVEIFSKAISEDNFANLKIPELGNLTAQQFLENLREKLRKHYQAKGKYNPRNPTSSTALKEKFEKYEHYINKKQPENLKEIGPYLDEETYREVLGFTFFCDETDKILEEYGIEKGENNRDESKKVIIDRYFFIIDDLHANFEEAERKKAEQENYSPRNSTDNSNHESVFSPNQNNPSSENTSNSEDKGKISQLEREKSQLEDRIKELQDKLSQASLSPDKIKNYENQLAQNLKEMRNKTRQIEQTKSGTKLESQDTNPPNPTSSLDWKWAVGIGLGVIIALLLLILIVVNISRRKKE